MASLEDVLVMWDTDSKMDFTQLGEEIRNIPKLHSKYLNILVKHRTISKKINFDFLKMKRIKYEYYMGKLSKEELDQNGWEPFPFFLKSDITLYMESDSDLTNILSKKYIHDEIVETTIQIIGELKSRTYQLGHAINYEKFINGA